LVASLIKRSTCATIPNSPPAAAPKSLPVSFSFTRANTTIALAFCTSFASASLAGGPCELTGLLLATLERCRGRAREERLLCGSISEPMMDWRRSEGKFGSCGDSRWPRRQVRRGSWMNCVHVSFVKTIISEGVRTASSTAMTLSLFVLNTLITCSHVVL
jgi:hypothetical protein